MKHGTEQVRSRLVSVMGATERLAVQGDAFACEKLPPRQPTADCPIEFRSIKALQGYAKALFRGSLAALAPQTFEGVPR